MARCWHATGKGEKELEKLRENYLSARELLEEGAPPAIDGGIPEEYRHTLRIETEKADRLLYRAPEYFPELDD